MRRRSFLAGAASTLAAPAIAQPARVLRFVPYVDLPVLDPIANTAAQVRNHAYLPFDTLYGLDESYTPQPQMLAGATVENDGKLWTLRLREGLKFHDGTPVLGRDCVASIRRWGSVDGFGATLLAATDGPEIVGSGPFRLVESERVPGSRIVYERFADYVPAPGKPGLTSGGKIVHVDRVEWLVMPEAATAADAVRTGAVDWLEAPPPDLLAQLRRDRNLRVDVLDRTGVVPILRFNSLHPPFDNLAIRRAVLSAVQQSDFMQAFSDDPANTQTDVGIFCPGTPMASTAGLKQAVGTASLADAKRAIAAAGYKGERVVMMEPGDHPVNSVMSQVGADLFKKLGLAVDDQAMDAATMFQRRGNRDDIDHGGWSCFPSAVAGIDVLNPAVSFLARGDGAKAWYGWPADQALEELRLSWFEAPTRAEQQAISQRMQLQVLSQAPYLPLGLILQPTVYRNTLTDVLPGFAKFWSVRKT
jgi:peptide/nickel transport system substrate-binding protein